RAINARIPDGGAIFGDRLEIKAPFRFGMRECEASRNRSRIDGTNPSPTQTVTRAGFRPNTGFSTGQLGLFPPRPSGLSSPTRQRRTPKTTESANTLICRQI